MKIDELLLLSGNDIPFLNGQCIIHQTTLNEISYITQETFWTAYETLKFDKSSLSEKDLKELENISNFKLIINFLNNKQNNNIQKTQNDILSLLNILFPMDTIMIEKNSIKLKNNQNQHVGEINENNFIDFKQILENIFCLNKTNKQYDPSGDLAQKIANQIKRGRQKRVQLGPKQEKITFLSRYASIIATAKNKSINEIMDYTVYQLMDEFNRFMLYKANQQWLQMKIAGATGLKDPEDWLKDIHSQNNNFNEEETLI